ncbi:MAG: chromosomal replication initiator protein DnaA [Treponema phagedenis]|uniref:chromosomal replication initiator protein DnaA n=1 Tax=Treponema phagedenis TaxID=162 RepID=UPI003133F35F
MDISGYEIFWKETLKQLKEELNQGEFNMWFIQIDFNSSSDDSIEISVPSDFFRKEFSQKYQKKLENKFLEISGHEISLQYVIKKPKLTNSANKSIIPEKKEEKREERKEKPQKIKNSHPALKDNYTFDNFVAGEDLKFTQNAALSVAKFPGKNYNPLLILGGVGLGKTHLMQAIGNEIYRTTDLNIIYVTAESFSNEFISALGSKKTQEFKNKYRKADVLLIDDIHFFQNKDGLQEELFHTFNALYESGRQIVFTCDRPIKELKNFSERLKSRCTRGLNVDLTMPSFETRCAILIKKLEIYNKSNPDKNIKISDEIIHLIAQNVFSNVRDLEGCLTKIIAFTEISGEVTIDIITDLLKDFFYLPKPKNVSVDIILRVVAEDFNISYVDLKSKKRTKTIAYPRQIAMYLARQMTELSTTELGIEFGGRDHTTIIHGVEKIENEILINPSLQANLNSLKNTISELSKK